jgi:maleate isomerase
VDGRIRLGMLTPSSNTVLEPVSTAIVADLPEVSVHFGRFKVTEIALSKQALRQFDATEIMRAAELLADAKVDVIAWNGTSASWVGLDRDEMLCQRITAATGIAACTSVLAFREVFQRTAAKRIGLVTPYTDDVQARIIETWKSAGMVCSAERHSGLRENFSFAEVDEQAISGMIRAVKADGSDAVAVVCTNMRAAPLAAALEAELGIPVYDSIAVTVWKSLLLAGADPRRVNAWGNLFQDERLAGLKWTSATSLQ